MKTDGLCSAFAAATNGDGNPSLSVDLPSSRLRLPKHNFAVCAGSWMYPGPDGSPLSSVRLDNLRDGLEDAELFRRLPLDGLAGLMTGVVKNGKGCSPQGECTSLADR